MWKWLKVAYRKCKRDPATTAAVKKRNVLKTKLVLEEYIIERQKRERNLTNAVVKVRKS